MSRILYCLGGTDDCLSVYGNTSLESSLRIKNGKIYSIRSINFGHWFSHSLNKQALCSIFDHNFTVPNKANSGSDKIVDDKNNSVKDY